MTKNSTQYKIMAKKPPCKLLPNKRRRKKKEGRVEISQIYLRLQQNLMYLQLTLTLNMKNTSTEIFCY